MQNAKCKFANLQLEVFILQFSISCSLSCNGETGAGHFRNGSCAKEKAVSRELFAAQTLSTRVAPAGSNPDEP